MHLVMLEQGNAVWILNTVFCVTWMFKSTIYSPLSDKTFFNMLGPMVNPAFPKNQMVGVFNLELARMYGYLYQNTDKKFTILNALDGYDEISLTGDTKTISNHTESISAITQRRSGHTGRRQCEDEASNEEGGGGPVSFCATTEAANPVMSWLLSTFL